MFHALAVTLRQESNVPPLPIETPTLLLCPREKQESSSFQNQAQDILVLRTGTQLHLLFSLTQAT